MDHKINEDILREIITGTISYSIWKYKINWIQHIEEMQINRLPKLLKNYKPHGTMERGRHLKRQLEE
jgi:hypothetical protein